jgi:negative regulator of flagellin synthesis FlgM
MKIGNPADKPAPTAVKTGTPAAIASAQPASAIPVQADESAKIELSNTAATLLSGSVSAEFDAEKVARVAKAIEDGTFKIDPEAIADKLIANAQEVLAKAKP